MIEVVFGQNTDVSLMMAQKYGEGPFPEGRLPGFVFYGEEIRVRKKRRKFTPIIWPKSEKSGRTQFLLAEIRTISMVSTLFWISAESEMTL